MRQTVRYWGETEEERQAAFKEDAARKAAAGWYVVGQTTEWPVGKTGLDMVVTYELAGIQGTDGRFSPPLQLPPTGSEPGPKLTLNWRPQPSRYPEPAPWLSSMPPQTTAAPEPRWQRLLRRSLVFGGIPAWVALALVIELIAPSHGGPPPPAQYPGLAVACWLEALIAIGLTFYLVRWRRLPIALRVLGSLVLGVFIVAITIYGLIYAAGSNPTS